jgi:hypothetical protein
MNAAAPAGMSRKSLFRLSRNSAYEGRFTCHSLTVAVITAGNRAISRGRRFRSCRHSGLGLHSRIHEHSWLPDPCWNSYACPASGQSSTPADVLGFARCNFGLPASLLITLLSCGGIRGSAVTRSPRGHPGTAMVRSLILFAFCSLRGILTEIAVMTGTYDPPARGCTLRGSS